MDYRTYLIVCLIGVAFLQKTNATCEETMQNQTFQQTCIQPFGKYMGDLASAGTPIMEGMCSKEGMALMACVIDAMKSCKEMRDTMLTSLPPEMDLNKLLDGGMSAMCKLMTVSIGDKHAMYRIGMNYPLEVDDAIIGPCSKIGECMASDSPPPAFDGDMKKLANVPQPYQMFHITANMYCRSSKTLFDCIFEKLADCPESIVSQAEKMMNDAIAQGSTQDSPIKPLSFADTKKFVTEQCPKMPQGLNDDCMEKALGSKGFVDCYTNFTQTYTVDAQKKSCNVYFANKKCIVDNVEPKCNEKVAAFLVENSHLIIDGPPADCKMKEKETGGSGHLQASVGMSLVMSVLCVLKIVKY